MGSKTIPELGFEIPEITQVAVVVEDLEDGLERFSSILGIGPWEIYHLEPPRLTETTYHGDERTFSFTIAITYIAGFMLELIEPTGGESIYTDHLEEHGEGLHHIACFAFDDAEDVVERFEKEGVGVLQSGNFNGAPHWYFDTRDQLNGVILETATNLDAFPEPDDTYPNK